MGIEFPAQADAWEVTWGEVAKQYGSLPSFLASYPLQKSLLGATVPDIVPDVFPRCQSPCDHGNCHGLDLNIPSAPQVKAWFSLSAMGLW